MEIKPRSAWGAKPAESITPWNTAKLRGVAVHWFGIPDAVLKPADVAGQLRGVQASHQAGEFNDIAYNFGVDPFGDAWELRGWDRQTGANGTTAANTQYLAIVVMIGKGDRPSSATLATLGRLIREGQTAHGIGGEVVPHHLFTGTECPGLDVRKWIAEEGWKTQAVRPSRPCDFQWARWFAGIGEYEKVGRRFSGPKPVGLTRAKILCGGKPYPKVVPPRGWRALAWYKRRGLA